MSNNAVYIVDDDQALRRMMQKTVPVLDCDVQEFGSAEEFLDGYSDRPLGCVLLDMRLPGMSGLDLLELISSVPPANSIIMLSGFGDIPSAVRAVKAGRWTSFRSLSERTSF